MSGGAMTSLPIQYVCCCNTIHHSVPAHEQTFKWISSTAFWQNGLYAFSALCPTKYTMIHLHDCRTRLVILQRWGEPQWNWELKGCEDWLCYFNSLPESTVAYKPKQHASLDTDGQLISVGMFPLPHLISSLCTESFGAEGAKRCVPLPSLTPKRAKCLRCTIKALNIFCPTFFSYYPFSFQKKWWGF